MRRYVAFWARMSGAQAVGGGTQLPYWLGDTTKGSKKWTIAKDGEEDDNTPSGGDAPTQPPADRPEDTAADTPVVDNSKAETEPVTDAELADESIPDQAANPSASEPAWLLLKRPELAAPYADGPSSPPLSFMSSSQLKQWEPEQQDDDHDGGSSCFALTTLPVVNGGNYSFISTVQLGGVDGPKSLRDEPGYAEDKDEDQPDSTADAGGGGGEVGTADDNNPGAADGGGQAATTGKTDGDDKNNSTDTAAQDVVDGNAPEAAQDSKDDAEAAAAAAASKAKADKDELDTAQLKVDDARKAVVEARSSKTAADADGETDDQAGGNAVLEAAFTEAMVELRGVQDKQDDEEEQRREQEALEKEQTEPAFSSELPRPAWYTVPGDVTWPPPPRPGGGPQKTHFEKYAKK